MFQPLPVQLPNCELRVNHCCCPPELTWLSIFESAMKPPLDQPPSSRTRLPRTCMRRNGEACETAHFSVPPLGTTAMFSAMRQKFCVALPLNHSALDSIVPLIVTSSGDMP